ncbi:MAG: hypothetical protein RL326_167 [Pseudomonadota bacterium]
MVKLTAMLPKVVPLTPPAFFDLKGPPIPSAVDNDRIIPSGIFYTEGSTPTSTAVMCNPWLIGALKEGTPLEISFEKPKVLQARHGEIVSASERELESYAEMIIRLRADFCEHRVDAVVVPLCGALRPASLLFPMGNFDLTMLPVPFTRGSSGLYDAQIANVLGEQLASFYNRDLLRLGILDTGIGGQSLKHLVKLLKKLHDEAAPHSAWDLRCNIITTADNRDYLDSTNAVKQAKTERFTVTRNVFTTQSLVGEDAKAALSYQVDWGDPGGGYVHPVSHAGALVLRRPDGLEVYPTEDIASTLDRQLAEATTRALQKDCNLFIKDVWEQGEDKLI